MADNGNHLLAILGEGVRPFDAVEPVSVPMTETDFYTLLDRAREGDPESGLPVGLPIALENVLTTDQNTALSNAVDRAAVTGAESALIRLAGRILRVDVRTRMVLDEIPGSDQSPVLGFDAFVQIAGDDESGDAGIVEARDPGVLGSARGVRNASLVRALMGDADE